MSLVLVPASQRPVCGTCSSSRVTSIAMTLTDGSPVHFASCHNCESRSWTQAGRRLDITTVLGKAQKHKVA
ncbi:MAG: hypothetical protein KY451_01140 [Actinobacteria bacterium]|nr:hypothetical protein [Actinomycetota bacterium]MBW3646837.1 hypothetical protein [Actinomycetota bacterium]